MGAWLPRTASADPPVLSPPPGRPQILGRNLEGLMGRAQDLRPEYGDEFVSVEHLLLAFLDDSRFGRKALQGEGLDRQRLQNAVKQARPVAGIQEPHAVHGPLAAGRCSDTCRCIDQLLGFVPDLPVPHYVSCLSAQIARSHAQRSWRRRHTLPSAGSWRRGRRGRLAGAGQQPGDGPGPGGKVRGAGQVRPRPHRRCSRWQTRSCVPPPPPPPRPGLQTQPPSPLSFVALSCVYLFLFFILGWVVSSEHFLSSRCALNLQLCGCSPSPAPTRPAVNAVCVRLRGSAVSRLRGGAPAPQVIGRDDEIRRAIQILSRRTKNNPCLIGEPGVGKTGASAAPQAPRTLPFTVHYARLTAGLACIDECSAHCTSKQLIAIVTTACLKLRLWVPHSCRRLLILVRSGGGGTGAAYRGQ